MIADTFINWPYQHLQLTHRYLPKEPMRDNGQNSYAVARCFQQSTEYGRQLARVTGIKVFEHFHTWEARAEFTNSPDEHPQPAFTFEVFGDRNEALKLLGNMYGYCEHALEGLADAGNMRLPTEEPDRAQIIQDAFGQPARAWFEKYTTATQPDGDVLDLMFWADIDGEFSPSQVSSKYVLLTEVLFVLAACRLINAGKLPIKMPPAGLKLYEQDGRVQASYLDADGCTYSAPLPDYRAERLRDACAEFINTKKHIKVFAGRMEGYSRMAVNITANVVLNTAGVKTPAPIDPEALFKDTEGLSDRHKAARLLAGLLEDNSDNESMRQTILDRFGGTNPDLPGHVQAAINTRQTFLAAYLELAEERGKDRATRLQQAKDLSARKHRYVQVADTYETHKNQFTRAYSSEENLGYYKFFQPMPAGVGSQWGVRYSDRNQLMYAVANEQLSLLPPDETRSLAIQDLEGHKAVIDLHGLTEEAPLFNAVKMILSPFDAKHSPAMWMLPRTLSAVMYMLHELSGGDLYREVRVTARDLIDFMNPRVSSKNRGEAFGQRYNAFQLVEASLLILQAISYQRGVKGQRNYEKVNGLIHLMREGNDNYGKPYYGIRLHDQLVGAMQGKGGDMRYMHHNFEIMRSYDSREMDLNPASQLAFETLASISVRETGKQELLTRKGDTWAIEALNNHLNIKKGPSESWPKYTKKFMRVLDTQAKRGTLKGYEIDGPLHENSNFGKTRIVPIFSDALHSANMLSKAERDLFFAEKAVIDPVVRKGQAKKRRYDNPEADAPKRGRGRPKKTG